MTTELPMTEELFREDAALLECEATVLAVDEAGIVLDRTVFYPLGGGQAGDAGGLELPDGRRFAVVDTRKHKGRPGAIAHVMAPGFDAASLAPGTRVTARIDAAGLLGPMDRVGVDVLNGIAHDPSDGTFLITGKLWPRLFRVRFEPRR